MKRAVQIWMTFSMIAVLLGCTVNLSNKSSYERIVADLTDDKMEGRLVGRNGNKLAAEYIAREYERIGLDPFKGDSYLMPYLHAKPSAQVLSLQIVMENGKIIPLTYGDQYLEQQVLMDFEGSGMITFEPDQITAEHIFIAESQVDFAESLNRDAKMILLQVDEFKRYLPRTESKRAVMQIDRETFQFLKENEQDIERLEFKMKYDVEVYEAPNVVGVIKGLSSAGNDHHAVVISAHFDSLGDVNGVSYSGAGDNASGVSALLHLAYSLKNYAAQHSFYSDIIVCAFNGEEDGLQGSRAFVRALNETMPDLHLYHINLDTIGVKTGDVLISREQSGEVLADLLADYLHQHDIPAKLDTGFTSDHLAFSERRIPSVTVGKTDTSALHTSRDTIEMIDFKQLSDITTALFNFIIENDATSQEDHTHEEHVEERREASLFTMDEHKKQQERMNEIKEQLAFGEYQLPVEDGIRMLVIQDEFRFERANEVREKFPELHLIDKVDGYELVNGTIAVKFRGIETIDWNKAAPNQTYRFDGGFDIVRVELHFRDKENSDFKISVQQTESLPMTDLDGKQIAHQVVTYEVKDYAIYGETAGEKLVQFDFEADGKKYYVSVIVDWEQDLHPLAEFVSRIPWENFAY